jgi:selenocysteine lyase/cysteine desulfurase
MPGVIAALKQITEWGVENLYNTLSARNSDLCKRLSALGLTPTPDDARGGHFIGAGLPDGAPADLLAQLSERQIYLSERGGSLRITPHLWNDDEDYDRLIVALGDIL